MGDGTFGAVEAGAWISDGDVPGATDRAVGDSIAADCGGEAGGGGITILDGATRLPFGRDWRRNASSAGAIGVPGLVASTLGAALRSGSTDGVPGRGDMPGSTVR